jgi:hypothetical protein
MGINEFAGYLSSDLQPGWQAQSRWIMVTHFSPLSLV